MSKINEIQNAIKGLNGGEFQRLMDAYLAASGNHNIFSIGTVIGSNKTRTGTPDALAIVDGNILFVEYSVQQNKLYKKFSDDIEKCLDVEKTGVELSNIHKIILGYTGRLSTSEIFALKEKCDIHSIDLDLINTETLSYSLYNYYPSLIRDILGLSIDTGQIVKLNDFVKYHDSNALTARLDTKFIGREEDVSNALEQLIANDVVLITGKPGLGKTRFTIEVCRRYLEKYKVDCYAIYNRGQNIFEDLKVYFSKKGEFLIFVDDANRVSNFDYFIDLLLTGGAKIKIIATVRDYSKESVVEASSKVEKFNQIALNEVLDDEIRKLIIGNFKISNPLFIDRIVEISQGNSRIAIMASKLAVEENKLSSLNNVFTLYQKYYSNIISEMILNNNTKLIEVAGIMSFMKIVNIEDEKEMKLIFKTFSIDVEVLLDSLKELHELEIVDSYENIIFKVSDQVMSTYLFFYVFIYEKIVDIKELFDVYYPRDSKSVIEVLNSVTSSFYSKEIVDIITCHAKRLYRSSTEDENAEYIIKVLGSFGGLLPTEVLQFLKREIDSLDVLEEKIEVYEIDFKDHNINDSILSIAMTLRNSSSSVVQMLINLILEYLDRRKAKLTQVYFTFIEIFGFNDKNIYSNFELQKLLIELLWSIVKEKKSPVFNQLFLGICKHYLKIEFEFTKQGRGNQYLFGRISVPANEYVHRLRINVFNRLMEMCVWFKPSSEIIEVLSHMYDGGINGTSTDIIRKESDILYKCFKKSLSEDDVEAFTSISHLLMIYEVRDIECERFESLLSGKLWDLYLIIIPERIRRKYRELGYDEISKKKHELLKEFVSKLNKSESLEIIDGYYTLYNNKDVRSKIHDIRFSYEYFLLFAFEFHEDYIEEIILHDFLYENQLLLHLDKVSKTLIEKLSNDKAISLMKEIKDETKKEKWLFEFWRQVVILEHASGIIEEIKVLYETCSVASMPNDIVYYFNGMDMKIEEIIEILSIVNERSKEEREIISKVSDIFEEGKVENNYLFVLLNTKLSLICDIYLNTLGLQEYFDYELSVLKKILQKDKKFIFRFIEYLYHRDLIDKLHRDDFTLEFIWELEKPTEYLNQIINLIIGLDKENECLTRSVIVNLFKTSIQNILDVQKEYILNRIRKENSDVELMKKLFSVTMRKSEDFKIDVIGTFLEVNNDFEIFKLLPIDDEITEWSGSAVPVIDRKIEYLKKLLEMCNRIELLDHREYIECLIRSNEYWKEKEKQRDFTGRW